MSEPAGTGPPRVPESAPAKESAPQQPAWSRSWPPVTYWARVTLAVAATLIAVAEARRLTNLLLLVLIAFVLAIGLEPAVQWLARRRLRRGWAVTIIVVGAAVFLALFVAVLVPMLGQETRQFAAALPGYFADLQQRDDWLGAAARRADASAEVQQFLAQLPGRIAASFSKVVGVAGTVFGRIVDLFTVGILCIYFMLAMPRLPNAVAALTEPSRRARVDRVLRRSAEKVGRYVGGNLFTSAVCGAATVVALLVLGVDYAIPLGMWAGVADLVPQVGAYLGAAPAVLVALAEGPVRGAATLLFFIAYQQFENYVLAPRVYKGAIDLSPAAVILSTLAGSILAGFAGALLALPVAATIKVVVDDFLASRRDPPPGTSTGVTGPDGREPG